MREDLFIIWGHGIRHLNEIMSMLRASFRIVAIKHHSIDDIAKFIDDIYACDSYPLEHLKAKTRYLLNTPEECFIVLVENHNVDEQLVGVEPYRKPQCLYLQEKKHEIRDRFNPRSDKGNKTENHVIHGTDYVSQVDHILQVCGMYGKEHYFRKVDFPTHYPWHLPRPKTWRYTRKKPTDLKVNIIGKGFVPITESPHYLYAKGRKKPYQEYHAKHVGRGLMEDHFPEAFDIMIQKAYCLSEVNGSSWKAVYTALDFEPIIVFQNTVLDGVHRLALFALCCAGDEIECINVDF